MAKPVNVSVKLEGRIRSVDQLIQKFLRSCKQEGFLRELKNKSRYESKSKKRRRKKYAAIKRSRRNQEN